MAITTRPSTTITSNCSQGGNGEQEDQGQWSDVADMRRRQQCQCTQDNGMILSIAFCAGVGIVIIFILINTVLALPSHTCIGLVLLCTS